MGRAHDAGTASDVANTRAHIAIGTQIASGAVAFRPDRLGSAGRSTLADQSRTRRVGMSPELRAKRAGRIAFAAVLLASGFVAASPQSAHAAANPWPHGR